MKISVKTPPATLTYAQAGVVMAVAAGARTVKTTEQITGIARRTCQTGLAQLRDLGALEMSERYEPGGLHVAFWVPIRPHVWELVLVPAAVRFLLESHASHRPQRLRLIHLIETFIGEEVGCGIRPVHRGVRPGVPSRGHGHVRAGGPSGGVH